MIQNNAVRCITVRTNKFENVRQAHAQLLIDGMRVLSLVSITEDFSPLDNVLAATRAECRTTAH